MVQVQAWDSNDAKAQGRSGTRMSDLPNTWFPLYPINYGPPSYKGGTWVNHICLANRMGTSRLAFGGDGFWQASLCLFNVFR